MRWLKRLTYEFNMHSLNSTVGTLQENLKCKDQMINFLNSQILEYKQTLSETQQTLAETRQAKDHLLERLYNQPAPSDHFSFQQPPSKGVPNFAPPMKSENMTQSQGPVQAPSQFPHPGNPVPGISGLPAGGVPAVTEVWPPLPDNFSSVPPPQMFLPLQGSTGTMPQPATMPNPTVHFQQPDRVANVQTSTPAPNQPRQTRFDDFQDTSSSVNRSRTRSKSPARRKLPTFSGGKDDSWRNFHYQFERQATQLGWNREKMGDRLIDCLDGQALGYVVRMGIHDYHEVVTALKERFECRDPPSVARRKVVTSKQREEESLQDFGQRVYFLTLDAHPTAKTETHNQIAVDIFLRGCRSKRAAEVVIDKNPATVQEAIAQMIQTDANHQAIYGLAGKPSLARKVTFSEEDEDFMCRQLRRDSTPPRTPSTSDLRFSSTSDSRFSRSSDSPTRSRSQTPPSRKPQGTQTPPSPPSQASTNKEIPEFLSANGQVYQLWTPPITSGSRNQVATGISSQSRPSRSPSPTWRNQPCFVCREHGHFARECPKNRNRSPSPRPRPDKKNLNW